MIAPRPLHICSRLVLTLGCLLVVLTGCLQVEIRDRVRYRWSTAGSGLVLREGPGLEYDRIGTIPFGARVRMLGIASETTILAGQVGRWNKIVYQGLLGYSYDAFLSGEPPGSLKKSVKLLPPSNMVEPVSKDQPQRKDVERPAEPPRPVEPEAPAVEDEPPRKAIASPAVYAYAINDTPGLVRLSSDEFNEMAGSLEAGFRNRKAAFHDSAGERGRDETVEEYLRRSERAKRRYLEQLRREEHTAATRVYSIYDQTLELGPYNSALDRFAWLGTSVLIDSSSETTTLPGPSAGRHHFVNGRKYHVRMSPARAEAIKDAREEIRVRIDFSYTVSLQDLFSWTRKAYFLPRYLMLYHRQTGRIYYACRTLPLVELSADPARPLRISSRLIEETVY